MAEGVIENIPARKMDNLSVLLEQKVKYCEKLKLNTQLYNARSFRKIY